MVFFVACLIMSSGAVYAAAAPGGQGAAPVMKGPITITSRSLSADTKAGITVFDGNVSAKSDNMELHANRMTVYGNQQGGGVNRILAEGAVKLIKEGRVVTAGKADYTRADDKIVFTENPKITEGKTLITGTRIVYYVSEDRTIVDDSKVFMEGK